MLIGVGGQGLFAAHEPIACGTRPYGMAEPNSAGAGAHLLARGSTRLAADDLALRVSGAPASQPALFCSGTRALDAPFGDGRRCVGGTTVRLAPVASTGASGEVLRPLDLQGERLGNGPEPVTPGGMLYFQCWYRDTFGGGSVFDPTSGLAVHFRG